jgi:hypothetical protein
VAQNQNQEVTLPPVTARFRRLPSRLPQVRAKQLADANENNERQQRAKKCHQEHRKVSPF